MSQCGCGSTGSRWRRNIGTLEKVCDLGQAVSTLLSSKLPPDRTTYESSGQNGSFFMTIIGIL